MAATSLVNYVILLRCECCADVHAVRFADQHEFNRLTCPRNNGAIFRRSKTFTKVYKDFQAALLSDAVAV